MAVHFMGYAAEVEELRTICDEHGLRLIEDAAQADRRTHCLRSDGRHDR